jgi:putative sigma-54 modulation protein
MKISIKATNLILTPALKSHINDKMGTLEKYLREVNEIKVEAERERKHKTGDVFRAEVMLIVRGKVMRAETKTDDMYSAIDLVVPKLKEQISKFKDRKSDLIKKGARRAKREV